MRQWYSELQFCFFYVVVKHSTSLIVFRDRVSGIFHNGSNMRLKKLHYNELHDLYSSPDIIGETK